MRCLFFLFAFVFLTSCENLLQETGDNNSDEAKYEAALILATNRKYDEAKTKLEELSATYLAKREVQVTYASVHAGLCGLDFLDMAEGLQNYTTSTITRVLLDQMQAKTATENTYCQSAMTILNAVGAPAARTSDENLLMAFIGLAKMGVILAMTADTLQVGTPDSNFSACTDPQLTDALVGQFGAAFGTAYTSLSASSSSSVISDVVTQLSSICGGSGLLNGLCTQTDPTAFTAPQLKTLRTMIHYNDGTIGLGTCATNLPCICP